ncbi:MAG TPA: hypothetical protein VGM63_10235 [Mucilaginibacter sp.]
MAETIFLLNNDGELVEMTESHYLTEDVLQKLLADYPKLISGDQINKESPRKWLLVSREMGVNDGLTSGNRWSLDHLFIDQDGIPTLVEVKRSSDTRIRREVIGQILDYAANAVSYWSIDEIQLRFENTCESKGRNPEETLNDFLQDSFYKDKFWDTVHTNLKAGKIRLLLIADIIPKEMQRIIEFLNEQMEPCEILGIEIKQFLGQNNLKTLVPRIIGSTINARNQKAVKSISKEQWDEERFFTDVTARDEAHYNIYETIYLTSQELFDGILWGFGKKDGSFSPYLDISGNFKLFVIYTYGSIEIQFEGLKIKPPFDDKLKRLELLQKINQALDWPSNTFMDKIDKRPGIKIKEFEKPGTLDAFFEVVKWYIETVKAHYEDDN